MVSGPHMRTDSETRTYLRVNDDASHVRPDSAMPIVP